MIRFSAMWEHCYRAGLGLLFPPRCACCQIELPTDAELMLCADCCQQLIGSAGSFCVRCGAIEPGEPGGVHGCRLCGSTRFHFEKVVALGLYDGPLHQAVAKIKEPAGRVLAAALAQLMLRTRGEQLKALEADLVVPVPMFWAKRFWRGFNTTELLAERLARGLGLPVRHALVRNRNTLPQRSLRPRERFANVRGAFTARRIRNLQGKSILLIDDVLTTGATCSEAARTLLRAGAARVVVAVLARGQGN
jgi:ComF family protein